MFKICLTALALLGATLATQVCAQTISAADQKGLEETYTAFQHAIQQGDAQAMGPLLTENAETITPDGNIVRGRANLVAMYTQLFEYFKSLPKPTQSETKLTATQTRYLAPDLVLYTYVEEVTQHFGEKVVVDKKALAVTLRRTGSKWTAELITLTPVVERDFK